MNKIKKLNFTRELRKKRVRAKIKKVLKPRLSVFKSNKYIYVQVIDDSIGKTVLSASSKNIGKKLNQTDAAKEIGVKISKLALEKGIKELVLDRGRYAYHGVIRALTETVREKGVKI